MKIAIRRGHNHQAIGSVGLVNEVVENEKILTSAIKYLKALGHDVLDVSPGNMSSASDLAHGVKKANDWNADVFVSIHCNKAYNTYNGAIGTECLVYSKTDAYKDEIIAQRIVNNLGSLGFKNRGVKERTDLYELKNTKMNSIIVECFFVEATEDVALYKKLGADALGKAIAEGITNQKYVEPKKSLIRFISDDKQVGAYSNVSNAVKKAEECLNGNARVIKLERI